MKYVESHTQITAVKWFREEYPSLRPLLFSVPNGGKRDKATVRVIVMEGVVAGVSDLLFLYPSRGYHGLCIEFKTDVGRQSDAQVDWMYAVAEQGYKYEVVRSFAQFYNLIRWWLFEIDDAEYAALKEKKL